MPPTCKPGWTHEGDRNYIFKASKQASKVTDFLLGFVKKPDRTSVQRDRGLGISVWRLRFSCIGAE